MSPISPSEERQYLFYWILAGELLHKNVSLEAALFSGILSVELELVEGGYASLYDISSQDNERGS